MIGCRTVGKYIGPREKKKVFVILPPRGVCSYNNWSGIHSSAQVLTYGGGELCVTLRQWLSKLPINNTIR